MSRVSILGVVHVCVFVVNFGASPTAAQPADMVLIPAGEFLMGDHHDGNPDGDELPLHAVYVDSFFMDIYEVTNQQYADALNWAWAQDPPLIDVTDGVVYGSEGSTPYCDTTTSTSQSRITWDGNTFGVTKGKEDHPMVRVSWYGAAAYSNWRGVQEERNPCYDEVTWECDFETNGYRLPTEAEREYACRNGQQNPYYRYPCGDIIDGSIANYTDSEDPYECGDEPYTTPVRFYNGELHEQGDFGWPCPDATFQTSDAGCVYGVYDVPGNVWEWCHDWYGGSSYYESSPYDNPHGPLNGTTRVLRGGSWDNPAVNLRCANRADTAPEMWRKDQGFRLVLPASAKVPTVSEWGLIVMSLLMLTGGTLVFGRRRVEYV